MSSSTRGPSLRRIEVPQMGAEDVVVDHRGHAWTGTEDGSIFRVSSDGGVLAAGNTGGRPLGVELYGDDRLLVADAHRGLLTMSTTTGAVEHTQTGRLLCRRADATVEVRLEGLDFADGVALAADESFVCVAETGGRTVVRLWLTGERAGTTDLLADDLPGYPDNIARGSDGLIWVTIASPVDPVVEFLRTRAPMFVRRAVIRLPEAVQPKPKQTVRVQAYDDTGRLVHDVDADAAQFHMVTGVREHEGELWLASLHEPALAVLNLATTAD